MTPAAPPYDLYLEQNLIGSMVLTSDARVTALCQVDPDDFHAPKYGHMFVALAELHATGLPVTTALLVDQLARDGTLAQCGGRTAARQDLHDAVSGCMSQSSPACAERVADMAARRRLHSVLTNLRDQACDMTADLADIVDRHQSHLHEVRLPAGSPPADLTTTTELAARDTKALPWVVPGLLRRQHRAIIVAPEGRGKSLLLGQLAACVAAGIHPFTFTGIEPLPTLIVDLENPEDVVVERSRRFVAAAPDAGKAHVWHRPAGINLRSRTDRTALDRVLTETSPALVCAGPLYKMFSRADRETDEQAATAVQQVLDELRTRHNFALVLEHHAPHETTGTKRAIRPMGSSAWLRWPEFGLSLTPEQHDGKETGVLTVGRWRADRTKTAWPHRLERGSTKDAPWPWCPDTRRHTPPAIPAMTQYQPQLTTN